MSRVFKALLGLFAVGFTLLIIAVAGGAYWAVREFNKPIAIQEPMLFEIERGDSVNKMAANLWRADILDTTPHIFRVGTRFMGMDSHIRAGEYKLQPGMSAKDLLELFQSGKTYQRHFTIREGLTSFEIVKIINEIEELSGAIITEIPPEGSLMPETYDYRLGEDRNSILQRLESEMKQIILPACKILLEKIAGMSLSNMLDMECVSAPAPLKTIGDVINLAAIVEKETGVAGERTRVAGVFINRLRKGMKLQTDPSVIYALTGGKPQNEGKGPLGRRLLRKDLSFDSPYNTYVYAGLPPGPIANPGRASIEAVLTPEEHDYLYFVADGTGGHVFSKTLAEHNRNVVKWRKIRKSQDQ